MKPSLQTVLALPAGLLVGYLGVLAFAAVVPRDPGGDRGSPPLPASARTVPTESAADFPHDLKHLRRVIRDLGRDDRLVRQLERMEISELRELALADSPDFGKSPDQAKAKAFLQGLVASELFRREGFAAIEWAAGLEGWTRATMLKKMVTDAAASDPAEARPWVEKVTNEYGRIINYAIAAVDGAKNRGAEDLAMVCELYGGSGSLDTGIGGFAADFDFAKFVSLTIDGHYISHPVSSWASRDREAALAALVEHSKEDGGKSVRYTGALFKGAAAVMGTDAAALWITSKLDDFPAGFRDQAVKSLRGNAMLSRREVEAVMAALPSRHDRLLFAGEVISPFGNQQGNEAALAAFGTPEARTEILLGVASRWRRAMAQGGSVSETTLEFFEDAMDRADLPESSRQQILGSLHQPPDPP